ncbi:excalibur calcium-binding domain-containing protein [Streptomyces sp. NPDC018031]|uniref:excalibur calcium-binding domain-containing protein n=1 Tax=Streptomyces sp. NPDC018031 TaxID=3365033 RepID=UPI00379F71A1
MSTPPDRQEPPQPSGRRPRWRLWLLIGLVLLALLILIGGIGALVGGGSEGDGPSPDETATTAPASTPASEESGASPTESQPAEPAETVSATESPDVPEDVPEEVPEDEPAEVPEDAPEDTGEPDGAVYYKTCDEAPHPLLRGEPGYRPELDRDDDGVACDVE